MNIQFESINRLYNQSKLLTLNQVKLAVVKNLITIDQYKKITGVDYTE